MVAVFKKDHSSKPNQPAENGSTSVQPHNLVKGEESVPAKNHCQLGSPDSEWVIAIREKLENASKDDVAGAWAKLSVYRVPKSLRESDDKSWIPQTVSLGPYHHGKKHLRNMERHKWRALDHVLRRTNQQIEMYLDAVKELEENARACYEGELKLSSNEFVEMMVLDACFLLELFCGAAGGFIQLGYSKSDPIFAMRGSMHSIQRDMIMLENQIPLFILDRLYEIQSGNPDQKGAVARLALHFLDPLIPTDEPLLESDKHRRESSHGAVTDFNPLTDQGGLHCLDVFRRSLLAVRSGPHHTRGPLTWIRRWSHTNRVADKRQQQLIHRVSELKEAGIEFSRRKTDRFWDIKFRSGILEIPRLLIHDGTKSLFLNFIAFEQCHLDCTHDITSYVIFMDNLIDSPADVSYLHDQGIFENWLGNDAEVAELFNCLCQEVVFDMNQSYLANLSEEVNRYYDHKWNAWMANLKHRYFNNPWSTISFFAAVVLLVLTFVQTFFTMYGYYKPHS